MLKTNVCLYTTYVMCWFVSMLVDPADEAFPQREFACTRPLALAHLREQRSFIPFGHRRQATTTRAHTYKLENDCDAIQTHIVLYVPHVRSVGTCICFICFIQMCIEFRIHTQQSTRRDIVICYHHLLATEQSEQRVYYNERRTRCG